ncbi:TPA: 50S ribosomal protein L19 [Candidatus Dependentiae bacterium]|nr:MAG: 50S ribosomal protein L19 [candidate division TM6 bacterium GW2011_GWF2_36_131]KKQ02822.1 MAG: 50S ribosomal protein L19 [candidate division TM6 bacterium GW2011_GWE2_36_25]KKQ18969.1 MAG: 50S ribosomal protein L19 [candidate division TM6 bacterium GW2011_GWA2_36_9]HBR71000.1 50S ribosomal protein L19 [Candidatus Dependentiae bacterium]HCU00237.1 50S ribosomal protein L19 [Candidatus Dependentiae bacterium]
MRAEKLTSETILNLGVTERDFPQFWIGDTIEVHQLVPEAEGNKERVQIFKGDVIAMRKKGASSTFTVRKIGANNVAVERIFPFYSPIIKSINVVRQGKTRRAKAYYMRDRVGKVARFKEKMLTKKQREEAAASKKKTAVKKVVEKQPEATEQE